MRPADPSRERAQEVQPSDPELIQRIAAGERGAMQVLFTRHQLRVYRFALRLIKSETLAEDLISEVFFDVWQQAARFEAQSSVTTWLLAITRNKAYSAMRRRTDTPLDEEAAAVIEDPTDDPE